MHFWKNFRGKLEKFWGSFTNFRKRGRFWPLLWKNCWFMITFNIYPGQLLIITENFHNSLTVRKPIPLLTSLLPYRKDFWCFILDLILSIRQKVSFLFFSILSSDLACKISSAGMNWFWQLLEKIFDLKFWTWHFTSSFPFSLASKKETILFFHLDREYYDGWNNCLHIDFFLFQLFFQDVCCRKCKTIVLQVCAFCWTWFPLAFSQLLQNGFHYLYNSFSDYI